MDAWRYEKAIDARLKPAFARVPYYRQTLHFTCGPAALITAMQTLDPGLEPTRTLELRIWREATTVFMTSGHGGCGRFRLALAAHRRGFGVEVIVSDPGVQMVDSVRSREKKEVMALVQADMAAEIVQRDIPVHYRSIGLAELEARFRAGAVPLVLISSWQIYAEKAPTGWSSTASTSTSSTSTTPSSTRPRARCPRTPSTCPSVASPSSACPATAAAV
jgi:hypothetical protein